jgi:hypothetical protein
MQGLLAGTSRQTLAFLLANVRPLSTISALPAILVVVLGAIYLSLYGVDLQADTQTPDPATVGEALERLAPDLGFRFASMLLWLWLGVKVLRFHLLEEPPSVIGAGGTLRATGRMFLYHLGLFFIVLTLVLVLFVAAVAVYGAVQSELFYLLVMAIGGLAVLWTGCRLFVGFVPVAIGETPPFFSGWAITEREHVGLLLRLLTAAAAVTAALVAFSISWFYLFGDPLGAVFVDGEAASSDAEPAGLVAHVLVFYVIVQVVSVAVNWYFMVFFANAYLRLTRQQAPLG